jgi:hypothetical protein
MSLALKKVTDAELRSICKERIEALEHWLRRLIDDLLATAYGNYFTNVDAKGNRLIRASLSQQVESRRASEPARYPRRIDKVLLEDAVDIVCKPVLFRKHFAKPHSGPFPMGEKRLELFFATSSFLETISRIQTLLALGKVNKLPATQTISSIP